MTRFWHVSDTTSTSYLIQVNVIYGVSGWWHIDDMLMTHSGHVRLWAFPWITNAWLAFMEFFREYFFFSRFPAPELCTKVDIITWLCYWILGTFLLSREAASISHDCRWWRPNSTEKQHDPRTDAGFRELITKKLTARPAERSSIN